MKELFKKIGLQYFAASTNVNTTTGTVNANTGSATPASTTTVEGWTYAGLTPEMKVFYDKTLIEFASPNLVHEQFGQKKPIPANNGKTIEFRRYKPLPKATTALTEGVTPNGQSLDVGTVTCTVDQYGGYVELTDAVILTAIDNNVVEATTIIADQAGRTRDTIVREVLNAGTNFQYAGGKLSRATLTSSDKLTVTEIRKAVRTLKIGLAKKIDGYYASIIHPDCAYDLMSDPEWKYPHQYVDTQHLYTGELGEVAGVRFVETTEAKIFGGAGASSIDVYSTLVIGKDAYGVTDVTGGGLQTIVKPLGAGNDPLNQRSTVGWKTWLGAKILVNSYMVRIESASTFTGLGSN